jgi:anthranilate synthase component 2
MLTLIDNYDSFTFNLVQFLGDLGATCKVIRNDKASVEEVLADAPAGIILSPGPCDPDSAGICLELIRQAPDNLPILGVCLGHQSIGQAFGGKIVRAPQIMHGKLSDIQHDGTGLFADLPNPLCVTRYHSLIVEPASLPDCLQVTAQSDDGMIMALQHKQRPIYGVQFHPESIASQNGHHLLANFLKTTNIAIHDIPQDQHLIMKK